MKEIPSCFFPTNVVCLDDDIEFLESLALKLPMTTSTYRFFDKPAEMLKFMNEEYKSDPFAPRYIEMPDPMVPEHRSVGINIGALYKEAYNANRFTQVSVVVLDYDMPGINGLQVSKQIKDPNVQKILLTGAADEYLAVEAFNAGLIHKFITKQSKGMADLLEEAIAELQERYFVKLSKLLLDAALNNVDERSALDDPAFIEFFSNFIEKNDFVEYYLMESIGSFILFDTYGKPTGLFVKNRDQMNAIHLELKDDEHISKEMKTAVRDMKKIFCYQFSSDSTFPKPEDWKKYLKDAHPIEGRETYYYGTSTSMEKIDSKRFYPFEEYKEKYYE